MITDQYLLKKDPDAVVIEGEGQRELSADTVDSMIWQSQKIAFMSINIDGISNFTDLGFT